MNSHTDFCNYIASLHSLYRTDTLGGSVMQTLPPITCKDGFQMSVQASSYHYCYPKSNYGEWDSFEVGFPNKVEPLLMPYIDVDGNPPMESVYINVPIDIVLLIIDNHGGIA
jgi:hypothetical protein